jgi:putative Mn2+ efflux pump MntP
VVAIGSSRVDLLGILFIIWGALTTLIGVSTFALGVGAIALIASASRRAGDVQVAAGLTAAAFVTLAVIALVWGVGHVAVGLHLRRLDARARLAALMLGSVDLVLLPYGTALGAYALWVLLHDEGRKVFDQ